MKGYGNYGKGKGPQVIPLCNAGKNFHMTHLSAVVDFHILYEHICRK